MLATLWLHLKVFWKTLWACYFSLVVFLFGVLALLGIGQGRDTILSLDGAPFGYQVIFAAAALIWAFQLWYWARVMYYLKYRRVDKKWKVVQCTIANAPRILGVLALLAVAVSCFWMSCYAEEHPHSLKKLGLAFYILAFLFFLVVFFRRKWFGLEKLDDDHQYQVDKKTRTSKLALMSGLPRGTAIITTILMVIAVVLFVLFAIIPEKLPVIGTAAVILLCFSIWAPIGGYISWLSYRYRLPVFTFLIILALLFGLWNDNTSVRLKEYSPVRITFEKRTDDFFKAYEKSKEKEKREIYVAACEGGGIRAGYWTAGVLGAIQDRDADFSNRLFAISSASGGSLGAAVFVSLVKMRQGEAAEEGYFFAKARAVLREDLLSPVMASMFSGNVLQLVLPFPVAHLSRGNAFERTMERAWMKNMAADDFDQPFTSLWQGDNECNIPVLVMNGTLAEQGKRLIASPICIDKESHFKDAHDMYDFLKDKDTRLSTAVHNSARFPIICPAGTLENGHHVVDGGYFDNLGATTALEIASALKKKIDRENIDAKLVVIMIKNTPKGSGESLRVPRLLPGAVIPITTILNIRTAHGSYAELKLKEFIDEHDGKFIIFQPCKGEVHFPLGWTLSDKVRTQLDKQIEDQVAQKF